MVGYNEITHTFEYKDRTNNLVCFSLPELIAQCKSILKINILTLLN